jgi:hypothetical protein
VPFDDPTHGWKSMNAIGATSQPDTAAFVEFLVL